MSHPPRYLRAMNSTLRPKKCFVPLALSWSHIGIAYRATAWPETRFERLYGDEWIPAAPSEDALASAAQSLGPKEWRPYLEFVPATVRDFILRFSFGRMEALQVAVHCPALVSELMEIPALTSFLSAHAGLRGTAGPRWNEINAVYERSGAFGVLEWLGLPASPQTLNILRKVVAPDLPKRFLEPLRTLLWEPRSIFALQRNDELTDRQLENYCHALAA
jgi:hypothetical protein